MSRTPFLVGPFDGVLVWTIEEKGDDLAFDSRNADPNFWRMLGDSLIGKDIPE